MATELVVQHEDGAIVCEWCRVADSPSSRARGLLGRRTLARGEGILLRPASSIHTFFMRFAIDAVFLAEDGTVVHIAGDLRPWRTAGRRGARAVLELASGECARRGLRTGDRLVFAYQESLAKRSLCRRECAARPDAASSVAPVSD